MKNLLSFFGLLLLLSVFTSQANTTKPDTIPSEKEYLKEIQKAKIAFLRDGKVFSIQLEKEVLLN